MTRSPASGKTRWAWALLVLASLVTWWPTWDEPFAEDDFLFLEVVDATPSWQLLKYFGSEGVMDHHYRPLSDPLWYRFAQSPARYHLGLQGLHALGGVLIFSLGIALGLGAGGSFLGALLWTTRDFAFPSMIWASGFPDLASTVLVLGALRAHLAFRRSGRKAARAAALALFLAAILTKETAIVALPLFLIVDWLDGATKPPLATWRSLLPYALVGLPVAGLQLSLARFGDAYSQSLYALSAGVHTLALWPVYAFWSFLALPAAAASIPVACLLALGAALILGLGIVRGSSSRALVALAFGWFTAAILPALFAPARVNTNYLALAAAGPCLALGAVFARWLARGGAVRAGAACALALLVVAGPALVLAKDAGRVSSGGWVDPLRARQAQRIVETVGRQVVPQPPADLLLILIGAADYNPLLMADLGTGFGPQSGLQSAFRRAYGRRDVRVATLPPLEQTPDESLEALRRELASGANVVRVLDVGSTVLDLTPAAVAAARAGPDLDRFRRALRGWP